MDLLDLQVLHAQRCAPPCLIMPTDVSQLALGLALGPPIIAGFVWILLNSGQYLVAYVWVFLLAIQLLALTLYPTIIAPLFNKFTPLEPGKLR